MLIFRVRLTVQPDEDRFHGYCSDLPGVHADGDTEEETFERLRAALRFHLEGLMEADAPIPVGVLHEEPLVENRKRRSRKFSSKSGPSECSHMEDIPLRVAVA